MILVNIKMPKDCNTCPFAVHYHSGGARGFYCSLSNIQEHRWGEANDDGFKFANCPISAVEYKMPVLDKIRAEIEQAADKQFQIAMSVADLNERYTHIQMENAYRHSLNIIDKYRTEQENEK